MAESVQVPRDLAERIFTLAAAGSAFYGMPAFDDVLSFRDLLASSGVGSPEQPVACIGNDETCPCQDGDQCHYKAYDDTPAMAVPVQPQTEEQGN